MIKITERHYPQNSTKRDPSAVCCVANVVYARIIEIFNQFS